MRGGAFFTSWLGFVRLERYFQGANGLAKAARMTDKRRHAVP
ncbi:hypothetical protein P775_10985 [Puniceibacterium antarcticum]|uniref:Uncharacterized protein n=1 Tax=Puniceibacterium antarcticum TaxID=1206336 RepID=A0A2G8RF15_9RHOB|nr:hypothetical protein P775_10985 [Puniceibacterium antarcticum]